MRKATSADKHLVTSILSDAFLTNPSVLQVVKSDHKVVQRVEHLAHYAFKTALRRNGVYLSSDEQGVAICYRYNSKKNALVDYWHQLQLVVLAIGINRVLKVLKRDNYIQKIRPGSGEYLYFWFLGVNEASRGSGGAMELKNVILKEARDQHLPIYLETSVEKNKRVYERFGFELYHTWKTDTSTLWFMKLDTFNS